MDAIVVYISCANQKEARGIARQLLQKKLSACVNIINKVESVFWWKGKVDQAKEVLLVAKTRKARLNKLMKLVKSLHSYDVPEIVALPIIAGFKPYLRWMDESLR